MHWKRLLYSPKLHLILQKKFLQHFAQSISLICAECEEYEMNTKNKCHYVLLEFHWVPTYISWMFKNVSLYVSWIFQHGAWCVTFHGGSYMELHVFCGATYGAPWSKLKEMHGAPWSSMEVASWSSMHIVELRAAPCILWSYLHGAPWSSMEVPP